MGKRMKDRIVLIVQIIVLIAIVAVFAYEAWEQTSENGWKRGTSEYDSSKD